MNLKGKAVSHKVFGDGTIKKQLGEHIILTFQSGEKKFLYNDTFKNFVTVKDKDVLAFIEKDIKSKIEE